MKKRLGALMLALVLMLTLLPAAFAEDALPTFNAYDETVAVTIMGVDEKDTATTYDSSKADRASANKNAWIDSYKEFLNVEVTRIVPEDSEALTANLNTMMAGNELPDIMIVDKAMFYVLAENGVLKDLSADFEAYDSERWNAIRDSYGEDVYSAGMYEGEMLGLSYAENFYNCTSVLWVRQDWLDALNLKAPATLEDLEKVAQAFVDNKMGGENTVGLGLTGMGDWNSDISSVMAAYGVPLYTWVKDAEGKYVYSNTLDANKEGLLKLQDWYKKGLIKSDFAVTEVLSEDIANGVCGMYFAPGWHSVTWIQANILNDDNSQWTAVRIPSLDGGYVTQTTNASVGRFICVRSDYEHSDVIFRMKELEAYVYYEARTTDPLYKRLMQTEDNYHIWNLMVFRGLQRGDLDLHKAGIIVDAIANQVPVGEEEPIIASTYNSVYDNVFNNDRTGLEYKLVFCDAYPIVSDILENGSVQAQYNGPLTENMALYEDTINASLNSAMVKVIMGEDISVYEQAVADWYANGGQKITDDVNEFYAAD